MQKFKDDDTQSYSAPNGDAAGVLPKAGVELAPAPNAGALCPNTELLPNEGAAAPNAGVDVDAPNAGVDDAPKAGVVDAPKAGVDDAPNAGAEAPNSGVVVLPKAGADWAPKPCAVEPNGWLPKAGCDCPKDGDPNGFCC